MSADPLDATSLRRDWERARQSHRHLLAWLEDEGNNVVGVVPRETAEDLPWQPLPAEAVEAALPPDLFDVLEHYARRVLEANQRVNLVSRRDPGAQIAQNILDSLPLALAWDLVSRETGDGVAWVAQGDETNRVSRGTDSGAASHAQSFKHWPVSRGTKEIEPDPTLRAGSINDPGKRLPPVSRGTRGDEAGASMAADGRERMAPFLLDAGSGSGVPGVPFLLARRYMPGVAPPLVMVESRGRKAAFLLNLVRDMDLPDCHVFAGRLEDPALAAFLDDEGLIERGILAARALGGTARALGWLRGLAGRVDRAVFFKGPGLAAEWRREHARWSRAGWKPAGILAFRFPDRMQYLLQLQT
ncbi:MAG: class I SAM-dependent methyltransferase [Candidatus Krumholzibacteriota bacterium]|nr:class I SAM-dependent methyltransferase [Candidatus Krumholzibacteriota bacterium]